MFSQGERPIPGYRLEKFLGRGQFGEVWAAHGPGGTLVALKFIALHQKTGIRELRSIQAVKRIKHANLCSVNAMWLLGSDGGVLDDHEIDLLIKNQSREAPSQTLVVEATQVMNNPQYLVVSMTLAEGSLDERLKQQGEGGIPRELLIDYMLQAARGIDYLNSPVHNVGGETVGIQHRDIKPANLLFAGDSVLVGDFGVAGAFGEYDTEATSVVGSLCYMSPESIKRTPSHSSDQYALAISYYQLRTGTLPFEPTVSFAELVDIHVQGKLRFPLVSELEREVLTKATSTNPKLRYGSCVEFVKALQPGDQAIVIPASSFPLPVILGGTVALIVAIVWWFLGTGGDKPIGPQLEAHTIIFEPQDTLYEIHIASKQPRNDLDFNGKGVANLEFLPSDQVHIEANANSDLYQPLDREFTVEELARADWKVKLQPIDAKAMLASISTLAAAGKWDEAKAHFQTAVAIYPKLKQEPIQETTKLRGTPDLMTYSPHASRVAATLSGDSSSLLGLLHLAQPEADAKHISLPTLPRQIHLPHQREWAVLIRESVATFVHLSGQGQPVEVNLGQMQDVSYPQITCSALSPVGPSILVGQDHKSVTMLVVGDTSKPIAVQSSSSFPTRVDAVGFDPSGKFAFAMGQDGDGARWPAGDVQDATALRFQIPDFDEEVQLILPLSETSLYLITETQLLSLTMPDQGGPVKPKVVRPLRSPIYTARLSVDGKLLVYSTEDPARPLSIVETESAAVTTLEPPETKHLVEDFDISADGHWLVCADETGAVFAIDLTQRPFQPIELVPSPGQRIKFVRLSSSGTDLLTLAEDGTATWRNFVQLVLAKP